MLELQDLSLTLLNDDRPLTEHFSFTLEPGEKAVLIGEEGNGKSTLLKTICDPALTADYCSMTGRIRCRGRMAYLPQFAPPELSAVPVSDVIGPAAVRSPLARELRLPAALLSSRQPFGTLSGGEKVRLQLLRLLLEQPDVLLLDEPTNDLDIETLEWLEGFLLATSLPVLYISHDETLIERTAQTIIHMEQLIRKTRCRVTVTRTDYRDYLSRRRNALDKQGQVARKQREDYKRQLARWQQIHDRVEHEQNAVSRSDPGSGRLLKKKMKSVQAQGKRFAREKDAFLELPEEEEAILTRFDPAVRLPAGKVVLDLNLPRLTAGSRTLAADIRLQVNGNRHIGITGRNGAGKSTLLELIWEALRERRDLVPAYMPQNYGSVLPLELSPVEHLAQSYAREDITRARSYLGSMRFTREEMLRPIGKLSGGQQAKLLFLDMVLRRADVLVLDEPTRNFSPLSGPVIRQTLADFGGAILSVSHDRKYLSQVCDTVYRLDENGLTQDDGRYS